MLKGLEPVVRKVQEPDGYASYREYEDAVRVVIDRTQRSIASEMEAGRLANATGLTQVACDLNQMLMATAICKAVRKGSGKDDWSAQRMMVLSTNKWTGGSDVSTASFAEKAKEMNIFYKLYSNNSGPGDSDDPFGRGGAFDESGNYRQPGRLDRRRCYLCNRVGHIARYTGSGQVGLCIKLSRVSPWKRLCFKGFGGHRPRRCIILVCESCWWVVNSL